MNVITVPCREICNQWVSANRINAPPEDDSRERVDVVFDGPAGMALEVHSTGGYPGPTVSSLLVKAVAQDSEASRQGVVKGMELLAVGGKSTAGQFQAQVTEAFRLGEKPITVTFARPLVAEPEADADSLAYDSEYSSRRSEPGEAEGGV